MASDEDVQSIHTMISNDTLIKTLHKEELCTRLKDTALNYNESKYILQRIKSKYEIKDRFDIVRHLSIDFGEMENIEITNILGLLKIFGQCIECNVLDSFAKVIESAFSSLKQKSNKNIEKLKTVRHNDFDLLYSIFSKIAQDNDTDAMSFAINEKLHEIKNQSYEDIYSFSYRIGNFNLIRLLKEYGIGSPRNMSQIPAKTRKLNIKNYKYFSKIPHFDIIENKDQALIEASYNGNIDAVRFLLTVPGINVNAKNETDETALTFASFNNHLEIIKLLLTVPGINVNVKNELGYTALISAAVKSHHKIVKLLLKVPEIDVNIRTCYNYTALILAATNCNYQIVEYLLTNPRIDVNAKDNTGNTALFYAARNGCLDIVRQLLAIPGIDVNAKNKYNDTAFKIASIGRRQNIVNLLLTVPGIDTTI